MPAYAELVTDAQSSRKSNSGDESPSSKTEESNHAENELKDDENVDLRGSADASATLLDADSGQDRENEGEGLLSKKVTMLEDLTGAELHFGIDSEELNDETESTLQDQSNIAPEEHDDDASDGERISAKEDFIELSNILHALKTTVEYPDDIAKHNEVRTTMKKLKPQQVLCERSHHISPGRLERTQLQ